MARIQGHTEDSIGLSETALENELEAISRLEAEGRTEPTYSVLHRSAGTLALDCNQPQKAREIVTKALGQDPHPEIADELRELLDRISLFLLPHRDWTDKDIWRVGNSSTTVGTLREVA